VGKLLLVAQVFVDQLGDFGHGKLSAFSGQLSAFGFRWGRPPRPPTFCRVRTAHRKLATYLMVRHAHPTKTTPTGVQGPEEM
jgi:hypothetical protein